MKAPTVSEPPWSSFFNWSTVKPGATQAEELASGAMATKVELLRTPFTESWNGTVQPDGTFAGNWTLIWSSPAYPARPAKATGTVTPPIMAEILAPFAV